MLMGMSPFFPLCTIAFGFPQLRGTCETVVHVIWQTNGWGYLRPVEL